MSKRKQTEDEDSDGQDLSLVDVNFDYYNIDASNDYHAIQRLFIQLFGPDAVETGPLTDLVTRVAEENGVGSTIKTDEEEGTDPYAVLTVISCRDHAGVQGVIDYVLSKTEGEFHDALLTHLREGHVGLVLSERLVNMPVQVMGPMYHMLSEEMDAAIKEGRDYLFTHCLFVSRAYRLTAEEEEEAMLAAQRSKRYKMTQPKDGLYSYHAEDEEIMAHATHTTAFGLEGNRAVRVMMVSRDRFGSLVESIRVTYGV